MKEKLHFLGIHDWSTWEYYQAQMVYLGTIFKGLETPQYYMEDRQRRFCRKCGKTQDEEI